MIKIKHLITTLIVLSVQQFAFADSMDGISVFSCFNVNYEDSKNEYDVKDLSTHEAEQMIKRRMEFNKSTGRPPTQVDYELIFDRSKKGRLRILRKFSVSSFTWSFPVNGKNFRLQAPMTKFTEWLSVKDEALYTNAEKKLNRHQLILSGENVMYGPDILDIDPVLYVEQLKKFGINLTSEKMLDLFRSQIDGSVKQWYQSEKLSSAPLDHFNKKLASSGQSDTFDLEFGYLLPDGGALFLQKVQLIGPRERWERRSSSVNGLWQVVRSDSNDPKMLVSSVCVKDVNSKLVKGLFTYSR